MYKYEELTPEQKTKIALDIKSVVNQYVKEHIAFLINFIAKERAEGTPDSEIWFALNEVHGLPIQLAYFNKIENADFFLKNFGTFYKIRKGDFDYAGSCARDLFNFRFKYAGASIHIYQDLDDLALNFIHDNIRILDHSAIPHKTIAEKMEYYFKLFFDYYFNIKTFLRIGNENNLERKYLYENIFCLPPEFIQKAAKNVAKRILEIQGQIIREEGERDRG